MPLAKVENRGESRLGWGCRTEDGFSVGTLRASDLQGEVRESGLHARTCMCMCVCTYVCVRGERVRSICVHAATAVREQVRERLLRWAQSEPEGLLPVLWSTGSGGPDRTWGGKRAG